MKLVFLGTSATFPTKERNHSAIALDIGPEMLLFDCGEGTQRQFRIAGMKPMKVSKIFLTHWHGDHVLGLGGMLQSYNNTERFKSLEIYGPKGTRERFNHLLKAFEIYLKFKVNIHEIIPTRQKRIVDTDQYEIWAIKARHHKTPCLSYSYIEKPRIKLKVEYLKTFGLEKHPILKNLQKGRDITWKGEKIKFLEATIKKNGRKFTYITDTAPIETLSEFAKNADILVCESTFSQSEKKMASERDHMTAKQAAKLAKKSGVKQLYITHFSQRYRNTAPLLKEARNVFKNVKLARDFLEIKL